MELGKGERLEADRGARALPARGAMQSLFNLCIVVVTSTITWAPVALAQGEQEEEAEPDCESICRAFPSRAPPVCNCALTLPGGGTRERSLIEMNAREVLAAERASYLGRMEGISDYWLIEHSNIAPVPTLIPYTRVAPGKYRQVTQPELQQHWIDTHPDVSADERAAAQAIQDNPDGALQAMGDAVGLFAKTLAGQLPVGGKLAGEAAENVAAGFDTAAADMAEFKAQEAEEQSDGFEALLDATDWLWDKASEMESRPGLYGPLDEPIGSRMILDPDKDPLGDLEAAWAVEPSYHYMVCQVLVFNGPSFEMDSEDGNVYLVDRVEKWVARWAGEIVPVYIRLEFSYATPGGIQRGVIQRETSRWDWGPSRRLFLPKQIRERVEAARTELPTVIKSWEIGGVNEGMPTQSDFVDTFGKAGFPGARDMGSGWP